MEIGYIAILLAAGLGCGFLNTLASSGSVVSLPILVMLGVPESAANATNRLPVFVGNLIAAVTFARKGQLDYKALWRLMPALVIGSALGALLAEQLSNREMGLLITAAVLIALALLFTKIKDALLGERVKAAEVTTAAMLLIFAVGIWLGLIVLDSATYLLLVLMLVCGYQLPQANALKVALVAAGTAVAILLFWRGGDVWWFEGAVMSAGSVVGGWAGARASSLPQAKTWAFRVLVAVIGLESVHLGWHYYLATA